MTRIARKIGLVGLATVANGQLNHNGSVTDYAPAANIGCPDLTQTSFVRQFTAEQQGIPSAESAFVSARESGVAAQAWKDWLGDGSALGYDLGQFQSKFPRVGLAFPGGGLRAAQYGAAVLNVLDARNDSAKNIGTGGLLQTASYITGLSGGSWLTGSLFFNDFPSIYNLVFGDGQNTDGWKLDLPFASPDGTNVFSDLNQDFYGSLLWSVIAKAEQGLDTSLTDPWARMIAYHFLNQTSRQNFFTNDTAHGAGQLWSRIIDIPSFQQYKTPFPIIVANSRQSTSNTTTMLGLDEIVYEISPLELASYDPNLSAGVNLSFAGTHMTNGKPVNGTACVAGFDDAGFMMGTSASLWNQIFDFASNKLKQFDDDDSNSLIYVLQRQLRSVRTRKDEVANWPNPFNGLAPNTFKDSSSTWLDLLDGSSNGENVPYSPLLVKSRALDTIITAEGSSDDANSWPNGTGPLFTKARGSILTATHQAFPPIPQDAQSFIDQGLNQRPTFFGCEPKQAPPEFPLVIYLPNSPPANGDDPVTNSATFRLTYTLKHTNLFFNQVFKSLTSGFTPNSQDPDPNWPKCLQCAAIDRARYKNVTSVDSAVQRSDLCSKCFSQYCYDPSKPTSKDQIPGRKYTFVDPDPQGLDKELNFFSRNKFKLIGGLVALVAFLGLLIGGLIWWRKRRERKTYAAVRNFHDDDAPFLKYGHSKHASYMSAESFEMPGSKRYSDGPLTGTTAVNSSSGHGHDRSSSSYGHDLPEALKGRYDRS